MRNSRKTNLQGVARPRHGHLAQRVPLLLDADARAAQPFELMQRLTLAADEPCGHMAKVAVRHLGRDRRSMIFCSLGETRQGNGVW